MEKQATMRQGSKRSIAAAPASFTASRRGESSVSLMTDDRKRVSVMPYDANDMGTLADLNVGGSSTPRAKFDQLESLGPSLLEVLTLVHPPLPKSQQSQQDAGEDAAGDNNVSFEELSELAQIDHNAKFSVCLSRSAILARVVDTSADNTRKLQEFFAKTLEKLKCEATGVVLLQESTVLLFLETTADEFLQICEQLSTQQSIVDVASMKILASCDDNPVRLLQGLYFRKIAITRASSDANEWTDDSLRQVAVDSFLNLVKFVKRIGPMPPAEIRKVLTNPSNSDQALLPSNDLVLWVLGREDVMTLEEFLELYNSPIELELESERVWPVHPLLSY